MPTKLKKTRQTGCLRVETRGTNEVNCRCPETSRSRFINVCPSTDFALGAFGY